MMTFSQKALLAAILVATGTSSAAPVRPAVGSAAVFKIMKISAATNLTAPGPVTGCTPKIATWGASSQCRGSVGALADGASVAVASSSGFSGSATFTCNAVSDTLTLQPGSTCSAAAAAPSPCASQSVNWAVGGNSCTATASSASHAATVAVTDSVMPTTGSAQFACYSGSFTQVGSSTCNAPANCTVTTSMGGVWGAGCQANYTTNEVVLHGDLRTLTDPGPTGYNGTANYVCNNGSMQYQSGTCANTPAPSNCTSQAITWTVSGVSCNGTVPATNSGFTSAPVTSAGPNTGSAQFTCTNGVFTQAAGASCVAPPPPAPAPSNCSAATLSWVVGGQTCSAGVGATSHNGTATAADTIAPTTGNASFTCNNGTYSAAFNASCVSAAPAPIASGSRIAAGSQTCVITGSGSVRCSGNNAIGQHGDGTTTNKLAPSSVVTGLSTNLSHLGSQMGTTCVVDNGAAKCWGGNSNGQVGNGNTTNQLNPVTVTGLTSGVTGISSGYLHTCAIHNGAAKCWGRNTYGQLGDGTRTTSYSPRQVVGLTSGVTAISVGAFHSCALQNGAVKCWGMNDSGQLGDGQVENYRTSPYAIPSLSTGVKAISVNGAISCADNTYLSYGHSCAIRSDDSLVCWGYNASGQLGDGTTSRRTSPVLVSGMSSGVTAVSTGWFHTCAIHNGAVKCWGRNTMGQLGDGTTGGKTTPVATQGLSSGVTSLSAGSYQTCVLHNGSPKCWGFNRATDNYQTQRNNFTCNISLDSSYSGAIGDGTNVNRLVPTATLF